MKERQEKMLNRIINQYIREAQPIGSKTLSENMEPRLSSATIRNEMVNLIDQGYLEQPHLSAGRIPTLKAWDYYLENLIEFEIEKKTLISWKNDLILSKQKNFNDKKETIKDLVKKMADCSQSLSFAAFSKNVFYYTGLTNLLIQPEFKEHPAVYNLSQIIDHLDEILEKNFDFLGQKKEIEILIGKKNPFGDFCGAVLSRFKIGPKQEGLIGILGPIRMDYQRNFTFVKTVRELINKI